MKLAEGKLMIDILPTVTPKHSYFKHAINFLLNFLLWTLFNWLSFLCSKAS